MPYAALGAAASQSGINVIRVTFEVLAKVAARPNYRRGLIVQVVHESPDDDVAISGTIGGVRLVRPTGSVRRTGCC